MNKNEMDAKQTGAFIAQLRKERGLTQAQLALKLNVTDKAVSRWETGKGYPDITSLLALSEEFGISVNELLTGKRFDAPLAQKKAEQHIADAYLRLRSKQKKVFWMGALLVLSLVVFFAAALFGVVRFTEAFGSDEAFENLPSDTRQPAAVMCTYTLHCGKEALSFFENEELVPKNLGRLGEVYAVIAGKVYYSMYSCGYENDRPYEMRYIVSVDTDGTNQEVLYTGRFAYDRFNEVSLQFSNPTEKYSARMGYFYDGCIVLNDLQQVVEYNIQTGKARSFDYSSYSFPENTVSYQREGDAFLLTVDGEEKKLTPAAPGRAGHSASKIFSRKDQTTWDGTKRLDWIFGYAQDVNGQSYIIGSYLNYSGETYMVIFEYRGETLYYADSFFNWDVLNENRNYVVYTE
ncbi:MAG: helix-turn-helix transcriptional regulator [Clostridia bacterium]|nr:helix-turn-helix transcriptional regulator [Clostridia bacterium]